MKAPDAAVAASGAARRAPSAAVAGLANLWRTEPAACVTVAVAGLAALTAFGLPITENQQAVVVALLTATGGLLVRARVSPVASAVPAEAELGPEPLAG